MAIIRRQQALPSEVFTLPASDSVTVKLPRPSSAPARSNTQDHVQAKRYSDEVLAGKAIIFLPAGLKLATVFVESLRIVTEGNGITEPNDSFQRPAPQGGETFTRKALFPAGTDVDSSLYVIKEGGTNFPCNDNNVQSLMQNLTITSSQSLELVLSNGAGVAVADQVITVHYDMGSNPDMIGLRAIN